MSELERLIHYWEVTLWHYNFLLSPEAQYFISETIKYLALLKEKGN